MAREVATEYLRFREYGTTKYIPDMGINPLWTAEIVAAMNTPIMAEVALTGPFKKDQSPSLARQLAGGRSGWVDLTEYKILEELHKLSSTQTFSIIGIAFYDATDREINRWQNMLRINEVSHMYREGKLGKNDLLPIPMPKWDRLIDQRTEALRLWLLSDKSENNLSLTEDEIIEAKGIFTEIWLKDALNDLFKDLKIDMQARLTGAYLDESTNKAIGGDVIVSDRPEGGLLYPQMLIDVKQSKTFRSPQRKRSAYNGYEDCFVFPIPVGRIFAGVNIEWRQYLDTIRTHLKDYIESDPYPTLANETIKIGLKELLATHIIEGINRTLENLIDIPQSKEAQKRIIGFRDYFAEQVIHRWDLEELIQAQDTYSLESKDRLGRVCRKATLH